MAIGFKRKDAPGPMYHPERDFAYITPTFMKQAIENMSAPPNAEYEDWKKASGVNEEMIVLAAQALADAQHDFVNGADPVSSLQQALYRRKFFDLPLPVRLLMMAMIGEVMVGAWFKAVREVSEVGEDSPAQNEMCRFSAAVCAFAAAEGAPTLNPVTLGDVAAAQRDVYRARCVELIKTVEQQNKLLAESVEESRRLRDQLEIETARNDRTLWQRLVSWIVGF